jgi:hypothetical protein
LAAIATRNVVGAAVALVQRRHMTVIVAATAVIAGLRRATSSAERRAVAKLSRAFDVVIASHDAVRDEAHSARMALRVARASCRRRP